MFFKQGIIHIKAHVTQVADKEHSRGSGVALCKRVHLPQTGNKLCNMPYGTSHIQRSIVKRLFPLKVKRNGMLNQFHKAIRYRSPT